MLINLSTCHFSWLQPSQLVLKEAMHFACSSIEAKYHVVARAAATGFKILCLSLGLPLVVSNHLTMMVPHISVKTMFSVVG